MSVRTVKVTNVSLSASEQDIKEFFSFSGMIEYVEINSESERSQVAYVTFNDPQGAETAVLLSGSTIVDQSVTISFEPTYQLPPSAQASLTSTENQGLGGAVLYKAENVVISMLAKGFILGKYAVNKAKTFDEKLQITSTVSSLDQKIGLSEKISTGATLVTDKIKEVDEKFQVSDETKSAFAAAEQTISTTGSAIMKNRYILTGTSWVTGAFSRVTKAAVEVGQKTKEKMDEEEQRRNAADSYAKAEDVVSSMLAKGFILGKNAVNKAKTFDEKLQITSTASSLNQKIGLSEKIGTGATLVTNKMKEVDEKFQVSDKAKSAFAAAEQTISTAGSAIMKNRYILTDTSWVAGAFSRVTKAAAEVGQKTKEKMDEEEHGRNVADSYAKAEDIVSSMLAKDFILGKDAVNKAKTFDEKLQITSTAYTLDQKIGLSEKISTGATLVTDKMKAVDEKFKVSDKTKSAFAAAEQTVSTAGSAIMKNIYILTDTSWVAGAFSWVTKAAAEVGQKTKEKMDEEEEGINEADSYVKAEDVVSSMLAKDFILGNDAVNKAKTFDEKLQITSTAYSLDQKIGLSEKINTGTTLVTDKMKEVDEKFQVSDKTKSAFATAEQTFSTAGSAIMKNIYILTGTSWVAGAFSWVTKAAIEVGQKTKEKMDEEEQGRNAADSYAKAEYVVSSMVAKGFILGKDAVNKAKTFDEKLQITSIASSLDQKIGLSEKIGTGATLVTDKMKEVDEKFQVSDKTKAAFAAAEQTISTAGSAIMKNIYILTDTFFVAGAFSRVTKAAAEVGQKTKEKMDEE